MNQDITDGGVVIIDRGLNGEHFFGEHAVIVADAVIGGSQSRIEAGNCSIIEPSVLRVQYDPAAPVRHPDPGVDEVGYHADITGGGGIDIGKEVIVVLIGRGHQDRLVIQLFRVLPDEVVIGHLLGKNGNGNKADEAEEDVAENEF